MPKIEIAERATKNKAGQDVSIKETPKVSCYRLIYNDKGEVLNLFESTGKTSTINNIFCGTKEECDAKIAELKLTNSKSYQDQLDADKEREDRKTAIDSRRRVKPTPVVKVK